MLNSVLVYISQWPILSLVIVSFIALYAIIVFKAQLNTNWRIPGPWGVPILGYFPFLTETPHIKLKQLAEQYGDVFGINLVGETCIVLNSYEAIKEAYLTRGLEFAGVPQKFSYAHWLCDGKGVFVAEGEEWIVHRRFLLQTFRDLGMGKNSLAERVDDVSQDLLKEFRFHAEAPFNPIGIFYSCSINVICSLLFNKHYHLTDPEFITIRDSVKTFAEAATSFTILLTNGKLFYLTSVYRRLVPLKRTFFKVIRKIIKEHKENLDESNPQDYLDNSLIAINKSAPNGKDYKKYHTEEHIVGNCVALYLAGSETTPSTMYWLLKYMIIYPEVQKKVQKELDDVVGRQRLPQWADRPLLPYTEAVLQELHRVASVVPLGLVKCNLEDTNFRGFNIPRRTNIVANLWAANMDPKYWSNPERFEPERFLDSSGKFTSKEGSIPFSIGKRSCAGESLGRMATFLFFTTIMHQFSICPPEGVVPTLECLNTLIRLPASYKIRAILRS